MALIRCAKIYASIFTSPEFSFLTSQLNDQSLERSFFDSARTDSFTQLKMEISIENLIDLFWGKFSPSVLIYFIRTIATAFGNVFHMNYGLKHLKQNVNNQ